MPAATEAEMIVQGGDERLALIMSFYRDAELQGARLLLNLH